MRIKRHLVSSLVILGLGWSSASGNDGPPLPQDATFSTLIATPLAIEGLTGDDAGNLYTVGRTPGAGNPCPVWRVDVASPSLVAVGFVPAPALPPFAARTDAWGRTVRAGRAHPTRRKVANGSVRAAGSLPLTQPPAPRGCRTTSSCSPPRPR